MNYDLIQFIGIACWSVVIIAIAYMLGWNAARESAFKRGYDRGRHDTEQRIPAMLIAAKQEGVQAQRRAQDVTDGVVTAIIEAESRL